jgi:hypothetical protein
MVGHSGCWLGLCSWTFRIGVARRYSEKINQQAEATKLSSQSHSHPRDIFDARAVLPRWRPNHLDDLSDGFLCGGLGCSRILAQMGHGCCAAEGYRRFTSQFSMSGIACSNDLLRFRSSQPRPGNLNQDGRNEGEQKAGHLRMSRPDELPEAEHSCPNPTAVPIKVAIRETF